MKDFYGTEVKIGDTVVCMVKNYRSLVEDTVLKIADKTVVVNSAESRWIPVRLQIPDGSIKSGSHHVKFEVRAIETDEIVTEKSVFLVPR